MTGFSSVFVVERMDDRIAFLKGQRPRLPPVGGHAQLVHGLVKHAALGQRMRLGQSLFRREQAKPDLRFFQGALVKDFLEHQVAQIVGQDIAMMWNLSRPKLAEFLLKMAAVGVEIVPCLLLCIQPAARGNREAGAHRFLAAVV